MVVQSAEELLTGAPAISAFVAEIERVKEICEERQKEIKEEEEVEKKAEVVPQTKKKKNWRDKYRSGRRYSFKSPEEYIEYARSKSFSSLSVDHLSIDNSEEFLMKKAKKRLTTSTEFALNSAEFGENLDATADVVSSLQGQFDDAFQTLNDLSMFLGSFFELLQQADTNS